MWFWPGSYTCAILVMVTLPVILFSPYYYFRLCFVGQTRLAIYFVAADDVIFAKFISGPMILATFLLAGHIVLFVFIFLAKFILLPTLFWSCS